uniref:Uncharacterized protein n=1 Tax=Caenorhabditis tropicalis TaxID=1561998 RepID=A0A1I7UVC2_9PELO
MDPTSSLDPNLSGTSARSPEGRPLPSSIRGPSRPPDPTSSSKTRGGHKKPDATSPIDAAGVKDPRKKPLKCRHVVRITGPSPIATSDGHPDTRQTAGY